ncbi:DUF2922 domain-containing protein [uncultured Anaerococcus sp.]|uniref:DUF2922 domain-containing protein n=1 Tax=uncultured Anaerococcus sp. TaxID=293428 RepID=UPI00288BEC01|nr:DUF2922 domain-containing protein [uncultured Anaerococcus sp.]
MEKTIKRKLKLYFKDADNTQRTVSIDHPKDNYQDADVKTAMDKILASGVLETKKGKVTTKANAEIETVEKSPFAVNEA